MRYMLDTNTCIAVIKKRPPELQKKLERLSIGEVGVSSIVIAELWYGIIQSHKWKHNQEALSDFLQYVTVSDWPAHAAPEYGRIRADLRKKGTPIGAMDLLIAAHALAMNTVVVTANVKEFRRVARLRVENWLVS
jgi:tRNA(fMet)-specific endonuclease VapC